MKDEKILSNEELLDITGGKKNWIPKPGKPTKPSIPIAKYGIPVSDPEPFPPVMSLYAVYPDIEDK